MKVFYDLVLSDMKPWRRPREVSPGQQGFFFNIDQVPDMKKPQVLAGASRVYQEARSASSYSYIAKSPSQTTNISRVLLPQVPKQVLVEGKDVFTPSHWDDDSHTYLLTFENYPEGVNVTFYW